MILYFKTASITGYVLSSTSVIDCVLDSTSVNDFVVTTIWPTLGYLQSSTILLLDKIPANSSRVPYDKTVTCNLFVLQCG